VLIFYQIIVAKPLLLRLLCSPFPIPFGYMAGRLFVSAGPFPDFAVHSRHYPFLAFLIYSTEPQQMFLSFPCVSLRPPHPNRSPPLRWRLTFSGIAAIHGFSPFGFLAKTLPTFVAPRARRNFSSKSTFWKVLRSPFTTATPGGTIRG